jgi:hypothetical protein
MTICEGAMLHVKMSAEFMLINLLDAVCAITTNQVEVTFILSWENLFFPGLTSPSVTYAELSVELRFFN